MPDFRSGHRTWVLLCANRASRCMKLLPMLTEEADGHRRLPRLAHCAKKAPEFSVGPTTLKVDCNQGRLAIGLGDLDQKMLAAECIRVDIQIGFLTIESVLFRIGGFHFVNGCRWMTSC